MKKILTRKDFTRLLGDVFTIFFTAEFGSRSKLVEVGPVEHRARHEIFRLVFEAPINAPLVDQVYPIRNPFLGTFELFLKPVGESEAGIRFEGSVSRIVEKARD